MNKIFNSKLVAVDTETTGLNPWKGDRAFMISMSDTVENTLVWETRVIEHNRTVGYGDTLYKEVKAFLEDESVTKVFFNAAYDLAMLEFAGINVAGPIEECSLAARICGVPRYLWKLKPLCKHFFDISTDDEKDLKAYVRTLRNRAKLLDGFMLGEVVEQDYWLIMYAPVIMQCGLEKLKTYQTATAHKQIEMMAIAKQHGNMMRDAATTYAATDAVRTILAWMFFEDELKERNLYHIYEEEVDLLINVTYPMKMKGLQLSREALDAGIRRATHLKAKARRELDTKIWKGFNPNSTTDKRRFFFDFKKLQPITFSKKTANPSVDKSFLNYYAKQVPAAKAVINYNASCKAKSTYFDNFQSNVDADYCIHTDLNQWGTLTGRYSGSLLTIPKRAKEGSIMLDVRRCFVPRQDHYFLFFDYKQIEARVYADEFEEWTMLQAFSNNEDVYTALEQSIEKNTGIDVGRQVAKNIFLGKIYGLGVDHMCEMIIEESAKDVDGEGANEIIEAFDATFPIVKESMQKVSKQVERQGFIRNRFGLVIPVDYEKSYKGVNYIIQSTAQRVIKRAMLRLQEVVNESCYLLLQIHDELMFEVSDDVAPDEMVPLIKDRMEVDEGGYFPHVELLTDCEISRVNWLEKEELEL